MWSIINLYRGFHVFPQLCCLFCYKYIKNMIKITENYVDLFISYNLLSCSRASQEIDAVSCLFETDNLSSGSNGWRLMKTSDTARFTYQKCTKWPTIFWQMDVIVYFTVKRRVIIVIHSVCYIIHTKNIVVLRASHTYKILSTDSS